MDDVRVPYVWRRGKLKQPRQAFAYGDEFGRWRVLCPDPENGNSLLCRCSCGTIKSVQKSNLRRKVSQSCGCLRAEQLTGQPSRNAGKKHPGQGGTHEMTNSPEFKAWSCMKSRCLTPSDAAFKHYGGRGIRIYQPWIDSFEAFFAYVGPRPGHEYSLDRINVNGHYEPGNVRWATTEVQRNNMRRSRRITAFRRTQTLAQWAREFGVSGTMISLRLKKGMSAEEAISRPSRQGKNP